MSGRLVINALCTVHEGDREVVVTRQAGGIVLDAHADSCCVLSIDEGDASALFDALGEWLG